MKLPKAFKKYFWDVNFEKLDDKKDHVYIITRILGYGGIEAARWMMKHYPKKDITKVAKNSREMSKKAMNFWYLILNLSKNKSCSKKLYLKTQNKLWPY